MKILGIEWTAVKKRVIELKTWEKNPRVITEEALEELKQSIITRGFHRVLALDTDNTVLDGNQSHKILLQLGIEEVWCLIPERKLTEEERTKVAIEANLHKGNFDHELLKAFDSELLEEIGLNSEFLEPNPQISNNFSLPNGDKLPLENMTFTLSNEQVECVKEALKKSKEMGEFVDTQNQNSNGNALARICELFLKQND